jgi:MoaA/NifB/PqqE/SkfB family radical SAM enzyme
MRNQHPARGYATADTAHSPLLVFYEATKACDLACSHCRACAMPRPHPRELDTSTARSLCDDLARFPFKPTVVFTGGDPLKRPDLPELIDHARSVGLRPALAPAATPLLTPALIDRLTGLGLTSLAVSIDGPDEAAQTALRRVEGTLTRGLDAIDHAASIGLHTQINTAVHAGNVHLLDAIARLIARHRPGTWSVFFVVPVGRGRDTARLSPEQYLRAFAVLDAWSARMPTRIKTTAAPFYRRYRYACQLDADADADANLYASAPGPRPFDDRPGRADGRPAEPLGINDGKGVCFVSHTGQVQPSGFLPITCGRFPEDSVVDIYQHHPRFVALRDPDRLHGKCGTCDARRFCGGSRARAYALTRDPLAAEPDCPFPPLRHAPLAEPPPLG